MNFFAQSDYRIFMVLPALWVELGECECCDGRAIRVSVGWMCWWAGASFPIGPNA